MKEQRFKNAHAEIVRLQETLENIPEAVTGQRAVLLEASVIAMIEVMQLHIAQLNNLVAIDELGQPIDQAHYDAMLVELHRLRHQ